MSTMVISNSSIVAAINSLIVEMVTDSSKQLQSNVMHALNSEYNYRLTDLDHVVSMLRIFAEYCQSVNQMAYNMQYYGSHNVDDYTKVKPAKIDFFPGFRSEGLIAVVKFLDCVKYNSYDDYATSLQEQWIATIERVRVAVMSYIISSSPEYDKARWG